MRYCGTPVRHRGVLRVREVWEDTLKTGFFVIELPQATQMLFFRLPDAGAAKGRDNE